MLTEMKPMEQCLSCIKLHGDGPDPDTAVPSPKLRGELVVRQHCHQLATSLKIANPIQDQTAAGRARAAPLKRLAFAARTSANMGALQGAHDWSPCRVPTPTMGEPCEVPIDWAPRKVA